MLLCDFYKTTHQDMYPSNMTRLVSYFTPRMSRIEGVNEIVVFGVQAFVKKYLTDDFQKNFFERSEEEVRNGYERILGNTLKSNHQDYKSYSIDRILDLHRLGYLPLQIRAIPEGTVVPIHVPVLEITNTDERFAWVVNSIESVLSCSLWHPMISASVGRMYRQIVNKFYDISVDDSVPRARALGDFSMRGQESLESAAASSAAFCLSFLNTATIPAISYLENYYHADVEKEEVAFGSVSTEHSVMCSNFAVDGDEITMFRRLLQETYPHSNFSVVSDSYDYWNIVDNILPQLKIEILEHDGYIAIRGDSGNPVEIVTETVFKLWNLFGGTVNNKGYKVLDKHVRAIYGDSITPQRCQKIYEILVEKGFACNNVVLGVGSFSMQCLEQGGMFKPYTRDTFGWAMKSTYCEVNGEPIHIFKNPKTDTGNFKKSQKGCCFVYRNEEGNIVFEDGLNWKDVHKGGLMQNVFCQEMFTTEVEITLKEIRENLWGGKF